MEYKIRAASSEDYSAIPSKYPQGRFKDKPCRSCDNLFSPLAPSHLYCSDSCAERASTSAYLLRTYGIDVEEYERMYAEQQGKCAICGGPGFKMADYHKVLLVVDHCHTSGEVRGLLCHNCNRALGLLQDNVTSLTTAIEYLKGATTIPQGSRTKRSEAHGPIHG